MRPTLNVIFSTTLGVMGYDKNKWKVNKRRRLPELVKIKQGFSCVAYEYGYTLQEIGNFLGFNHATIYHHKTQAEWFALHEQEYAQVLNKIRTAVKIVQATPDKPKQIAKRKAAHVYASICVKEEKDTARKSFFDGIIFWDMVQAGAVTPDMINVDFFRVLYDNMKI